MPDVKEAKLLHKSNIQILFDLLGHTADNKLQIFALMPAPIEVSWLGYFATTGLAEIDQFVGHLIMAPIEKQKGCCSAVVESPENLVMSFSDFQFLVSNQKENKKS